MSRSDPRAEHHGQLPTHQTTTRVFGGGDQNEINETLPSSISPLRHILSRHPSILSRHRSLADRDGSPLSAPAQASAPAPEERPPIPSALQQPGDSYATPLPKIPMIVLSITLLGEFLTANVSMPFLLFMVEGFDEFSPGADVGFATGLLVSTFFFTQFLTSLLWATVAEKHGQRLVLFVSLLGSSFTCALFGTSTTLKQAIVIRMMQGVFAGSMGVARSCVTVISDPSNEGRAYAILGFCWGLGGVAGAIVGGTCQSRVP
jgi:Major Facilitator Superfamily